MATNTGSGSNRPLSPHLQVYRWPITMATSILHRATGIGNTLGTVLLAAWLMSAAAGPEAYAGFAAFMDSLLGRLILLGFTWSLVYHLCNGIRHLSWDTGTGFDQKTADFTGMVVIVGSAALTVVIWLLGYAAKGGLL